MAVFGNILIHLWPIEYFCRMNRITTYIVIAISACIAGACDMLQNQPYTAQIKGPTNLNTTNAGLIESAGLKPPFKFAFITDTQGSLNEMKSALDIIVGRGDIDFIIHGGDQTDFGIVKEFVWTRDMLLDTGIPFVSVIGNHDCLGNGNATFDYIYGPQNFSFDAGPVHIMCLNTVALEYDYSRPVPDLVFIEDDIAAANKTAATHSIVVMHSRPYDEQFNNNVAKTFNYYISQLPGMKPEDPRRVDGTCAMSFCLNGHNHSTMVKDIFDNGILYYQCANIAKRAFFIFTITDDGYEYEEVDF